MLARMGLSPELWAQISFIRFPRIKPSGAENPGIPGALKFSQRVRAHSAPIRWRVRQGRYNK